MLRLRPCWPPVPWLCHLHHRGAHCLKVSWVRLEATALSRGRPVVSSQLLRVSPSIPVACDISSSLVHPKLICSQATLSARITTGPQGPLNIPKRTATDGCGKNAWRLPTSGCFTIAGAISVGAIVVLCVGSGIAACVSEKRGNGNTRSLCDRCLGRRRNPTINNGDAANRPADFTNLRQSASRTAPAYGQESPFGNPLQTIPRV